MVKKLILWWACAILVASCASASVVINQVLYNPSNTESGGEAIELYNNGNADVDISGFVIATEATMTDAVIPANTIICADCYYLIADNGWNESKDNASWPDADLEEPINLYNSDSGVALSDNETIIDAVGWGSPDSITENLFEGTPADGAGEGKVLLRIKDTNNNIDDFAESEPFFRSSSDIGTGSDSVEIDIEFDINNVSQQTSQMSIDYVNISEGRKITPVPGGTATITVNAQLTGQNIDNVTATLSGTTAMLSKIKEVNATTSVFSASFGFNYYMPPGNYSILVEAESSNSKTDISISFEYLPLVAIGVSSASVDFGEIVTDKEHYSEIKIKNLGNTIVDIGVRSKGFSSENGDVYASSMYYSFDGNSFNKMSANTVIKDVNLGYGKDSEITSKLKLVAPESSSSGKYSGNIDITAVGSKD